jgi:transcriptional regulator with XRE-family HTH domain
METMFSHWLSNRMQIAGLNQSKLAHHTRINQGAISRLLSGKNAPSPESCKEFARVFKLPIDEVYRAANLLPAHPDIDEDFEEIKYLFSQMTDIERREFLAFGRMKLDLRDEQGELLETKQARPVGI